LNDTFVYDAASRLTSAVSARYSNTVARTYDAASRLATETQTLGGVNYVLGYAYDASNRQTSVTYPSGKVVARTFTARNQLATVSFDGTNVVNPISYDNGMRRTTMAYNNGRADTIGYGTRLDNLPVSKSTDGSTTNFAYGWDANKRKTGENDSIVTNNVQTFGYDFEDRLTSFNRSSVYTQAWTLTTVGDWSAFNDNGSSTSRTHNSVHELTAIGATALTYDTKGNLTTNSNAQTYAWDFENRLTSTVVPTGSTIGTVGTHSYKYDALGRRVSKTVAGTTTTVYVSDGLQEIAEYANGGAANAPQIQYVFGSYIDEPLMMISGSNKYYYHSNNLYSVAALTDSGGSVVERYRYDPYGKVTILAADGVTLRTASSYGNPWTFTGRRSDGETGLMFYRARYYSAELGRFIGRDPIGYMGSPWNLYEYVNAKPNFAADPLGLGDLEDCIKRCLEKDYYDTGAVLGDFQACRDACQGTKVDPDKSYSPIRNADESTNKQDSQADDGCGCIPLAIYVNSSGESKIKKTSRTGRGGKPQSFNSPFGIANVKSGGNVPDKPELGKTDNWASTNHSRLEIQIPVKGDPKKCKVEYEIFRKRKGEYEYDTEAGQQADEYNMYIVGSNIFLYDSPNVDSKWRITVTSSDNKVILSRSIDLSSGTKVETGDLKGKKE